VFATACRCATLGRVAWGRRAHGPAHGQLKARRRGKAGRTWHVDETSVKVEGRWCYLYRAIDSDGNLVETMLSTTRDMDAAQRFFACALKAVGQPPEKVTTDVYDSYPRAVRETLGPDVHHGASRYMNNRIEHDHRASRSAPTRCAGSALSTPRRVSVQRMTTFATTFAPAPTSTKLSLLPNNAACSGERWGEACALPQAA